MPPHQGEMMFKYSSGRQYGRTATAMSTFDKKKGIVVAQGICHFFDHCPLCAHHAATLQENGHENKVQSSHFSALWPAIAMPLNRLHFSFSISIVEAKWFGLTGSMDESILRLCCLHVPPCNKQSSALHLYLHCVP